MFTISFHQLVITASDGGSPPYTSTHHLTIQVEDVNDNKPVFIFPSNNNTTLKATIRSDEPIARIKVT